MTTKAVPNGGYRNAAMHGPMVPAPPIAELIRPLVERDGGPAQLARTSGVSDRRIYSILTGRQAWVSFDVADRLITYGLGDPSLWRSVPELAAVISAGGGSLIEEEAEVA
jgi:hypothetical protein